MIPESMIGCPIDAFFHDYHPLMQNVNSCCSNCRAPVVTADVRANRPRITAPHHIDPADAAWDGRRTQRCAGRAYGFGKRIWSRPRPRNRSFPLITPPSPHHASTRCTTNSLAMGSMRGGRRGEPRGGVADYGCPARGCGGGERGGAEGEESRWGQRLASSHHHRRSNTPPNACIVSLCSAAAGGHKESV
jgi:hypothetical protein